MRNVEVRAHLSPEERGASITKVAFENAIVCGTSTEVIWTGENSATSKKATVAGLLNSDCSMSSFDVVVQQPFATPWQHGADP